VEHCDVFSLKAARDARATRAGETVGDEPGRAVVQTGLDRRLRITVRLKLNITYVID